LEIVQPNNLGNKVISFVFPEIGHIVQMTKTTKAGEIMLACAKGLYFGEVSDVGEVRISINPNEVYFKEQDVKSAIEFRRDHVATCFDMDFNVHIIDRKHRQVVRVIENPSNSDNPLCLRLIPGFDYDKFPFLLLRDKEGVTIINLRTHTAFRGWATRYQQQPFPQMLMECQANKESGTITCFVLEYTGKDSALVRYEISPDYVGALKVMVRNEM
jgi:hypothetical protein